MNYEKHYTKLIERAKLRKIGGYKERHHIIPRCMGGGDEKANLVDLTPEEHYVAHQLLVKMYPRISGLWFACVMMTTSLEGRNNKLYGWIRKNANKKHSNSVKDGWARKRGFDDYLTQATYIWNLFITEKKSTKEIKDICSCSLGLICSSLLWFSNITSQEVLLANQRHENNSISSKKIRANITPEQEAARIVACKSVDYTERNKKMSKDRMGKGNPVYGMRWTLKNPRKKRKQK